MNVAAWLLLNVGWNVPVTSTGEPGLSCAACLSTASSVCALLLLLLPAMPLPLLFVLGETVKACWPTTWATVPVTVTGLPA